MNFTEVEANEDRAAPDHVLVPPHAFSAEWEDRPREEVCIGLRPVSRTDLIDAAKDAADAATKLYPRAPEGEPFYSLWAQHFDEMRMRAIIARGTCDVNDASQPWEGWRDEPDELARHGLTSDGTLLIFDAWERMRISSDVTLAPISDDDIESLLDRLDTIDRLETLRARRVRQLLSFILNELRTLD